MLHIWHPPKGSSKAKKQTISNVDTDDIDDAIKAYKSGASLYFSSSLEFRNLFCKQLQFQMGHDFAGYFPGTGTELTPGDTMGEIEIFVSRADNFTDFHTDFQENFTFQLKGSKRWHLRAFMPAPLLGFTPHYENTGNLETQSKVHAAFQGLDMGAQYNKERIMKEGTSVLLEEGDIMYHPAGIWHSVHSVTDSISINFSLRQIRLADLVTNSIKMHLLRD
jgi:hypothetical protein